LGEPIVIAVKHISLLYTPWSIGEKAELHAARKELAKYLAKLARIRAKRTLYIEGSQKTVEIDLANREEQKEIVKRHLEAIKHPNIIYRLNYQKPGEFYPLPEPFQIAVLAAKRYGWEIKPLDSNKRSDELIANIINKDNYLTLTYYAKLNLRERRWAIKTKKASENDIIVMYPDHVSGFLQHSGISPKRVVWISKETREARELRPSPEKVRRVREKRREEARRRYLRIKREKGEKVIAALRKMRPK